MDIIITEPFVKGSPIIDIGYLSNCSIDAEIGTKQSDATNDIEIKMPLIDAEQIDKASLIIGEGDVGGIVDGRIIDTEQKTVTLHCLTWRCLLDSQILEPPDGEAYMQFTGDANKIIQSLIDDYYDGLIKGVKNLAGKTITGKARYESKLQVLESALSKADMRLSFNYDDGSVYVSAVPVNMHNDVVINNDYGIPLVAQDQNGYNHIIALGQGTFESRTKIELWIKDDGTITDQNEIDKGVLLRTYLYDYPNAESAEELRKYAEKKLKEVSGVKNLKVHLDEGEYEIGDVIRANERIIGIDMQTSITKKIITGEICNGVADLKTEYKVGD